MKPKTEFKASENTKHCFTLYVNDHKTNIYFFTPSYQHYNLTSHHNKQGAARIAQMLIEQEQVKPYKGDTWKVLTFAHIVMLFPQRLLKFQKWLTMQTVCRECNLPTK